MRHHINNKGQILVVVMLILIVVAMIVLGVASRSITNVKVANTQENSARAFAAAEAGVEEAVQKIKNGDTSAGSGPLQNQSSYAYSITTVGNSSADYLSSTQLAKDTDVFQVLLARNTTDATPNEGYPAGVGMVVMWGNPGDTTTAMEATLITYNAATGVWSTATNIADPAAALPGRAPSTLAIGGSFTSTNNNIGTSRMFAHTTTVSMGNTGVPVFLRIRLLYNATPQYVGVEPQQNLGSILPQQGYKITSTGTLPDGTTRKVQVYESFPALPGIFDYTLFSGGDLAKL